MSHVQCKTKQTTQSNQTSLPTRSPQSALFQAEDHFELTVDLPGADLNEIQVEMKGNRLFLEAPTEQGFKYNRTYTFSPSYSWGDLSAKWELGRLKLILPLLKPQTQTVPITVG